ncbi:unnamed protein product [Dicrocoelium dendriticum]|nr:unnamed protein product [Dicrocoelium dendriticum]
MCTEVFRQNVKTAPADVGRGGRTFCLSAKPHVHTLNCHALNALLFQVEENEAVVEYALRKRPINIVETKLFGEKGYQNFKGFHFHPTMELTRRYYPHKHNVDGFFVAKLKKVG